MERTLDKSTFVGTRSVASEFNAGTTSRFPTGFALRRNMLLLKNQFPKIIHSLNPLTNCDQEDSSGPFGRSRARLMRSDVPGNDAVKFNALQGIAASSVHPPQHAIVVVKSHKLIQWFDVAVNRIVKYTIYICRLFRLQLLNMRCACE